MDINIPEISSSDWKLFIENNELIKKSTLVLIYKNNKECLTSNDLLKIGAIFVSTFNTK